MKPQELIQPEAVPRTLPYHRKQMTQTVILVVKKDMITVYNRFTWSTYHNLPLWKKINFWLVDNYIGQHYPFSKIYQIANYFPTIEVILPALKDTFRHYPNAVIKLSFVRN